MSVEKVIDDVDVVLRRYGLGIDEYRSDDKGIMSMTIVPIILRQPRRKRCFYKTFCVTWVQDVLSFEANKTIFDFNNRFTNRQKDSRYVKGLPKNGSDEYVGIYFEDPVTI